MTGRSQEIADGLAQVRQRIERAADSAGRDPASVTLTVVTKFFPASDVRILADLGVLHVGENRHQEAEAKAAETADLGLVWHFVGNLQSKKAAAVARYAHVVESVDRTKLLTGLGSAAAERGDVDVLVQVSLGDDPSGGRSGAAESEVARLAAAVVAAPGVRLKGVMAVAPLGADPAGAFERLAKIAAGVTSAHPDADWISAGMSADLEEAVRAGATHVRIGSAVLGPRPAIK